MSHEIDMSNDRANMAFTGSRNAVWHGLGHELTRGAPIDTWVVEAGMDWEAKESQVTIQTVDSIGIPNVVTYPKRKALYRSDTLVPLSIVGEDFNVVQPKEVLEFFRDLTEVHGMTLSTAGCLFGGQRFWALAETGREGEVVNGDTIKGFLLFMTALDGSMSSTAKFVSTRVVCNNTMTIALNENAKNVVRKTHKTVWDSNQAKIDLGLLDASWESFMSNLRTLSERKMSDDEVRKFFQKTFYDPKKEEDEQGWGYARKMSQLMNLYQCGEGAEFSHGTAYGALNAITDMFTHGSGNRKKSADWAFQGAYYDNDVIKAKTLNNLLELC
jgi:phage/plasmid-like protein (TIGR03299 family)